MSRSSVVFAILLAGMFAAATRAQTRTERDGASKGKSATIESEDSDRPEEKPVTRSRPVGAYPMIPFYRGNSPQSAGAAGFYLNLWAIGTVLILAGVWVRVAAWIDDDGRRLKMPHTFWNTLVVLGGVLGTTAVLTIPEFSAGLIVMLAGCGIPIGLYIGQRNARVTESRQVMTPLHIQTLLTLALIRAGMKVGPRELQAAAVGPPVTLLTKTRTTGRSGKSVRSRELEASPAWRTANELIYDALVRRVSDVHLEPTPSELHSRYRIDGIMYQAEEYDAAMGSALINIFKILAAMDITERRRPQDGSFQAECQSREIDFRVATQGTSNGEKMSLRVLDKSNALSNLSELGLRRHLQGQIRSVVEQPQGLFLSCGPTGAGKSTTLRAALLELDPESRNIITVEDPVEYQLDHVTQIEINTKAGQTFAGSLRSVLRQDPDVILVGEIRDGETATTACQAATTGHMVFSTVHANDTITALHRLMELGVEPFMVADSTSAILGQRLVRRLCDACKEPYQPDPVVLREHRIPAGKVNKFYRPPRNPSEICTTCGGLGFSGRVGVFELLVITDSIRTLIRNDLSIEGIRAAARRDGMTTMKQEGLRLVMLGTTTLDELNRVVK